MISMGLNTIIATVEQLLLACNLSSESVTWLVANDGWRIMMMLGTLPALLTFFFRMCVPESHKWEEGRDKGHTSGWRTEDLLGVLVGVSGPALIIYVWAGDHSGWMRGLATPIGLIIATVGFSYPVVRYLQRQFGEAGSESTSEQGSALVCARCLVACSWGLLERVALLELGARLSLRCRGQESWRLEWQLRNRI